jgi:hypothetical protein
MTSTIDRPVTDVEPADADSDGPLEERADRWPSPLVVAGCASIGAGAIHAAVVGAHAEHRTLAMLFVWAAAFQIALGIAALVRPSRTVAAWLGIGNLALAATWLVTRLAGVSFIDGLEVREPIEFADAAAAGLAIVAGGLALGSLLSPQDERPYRLTNLGVPAFLVAALALPAMVSGGTTVHGHDDTGTGGHDHSTAVVQTGDPNASADGHGHAADGSIQAADGSTTVTLAVKDDSGSTSEEPPASTAASTGTQPPATAAPAVVPPKPYDPTQPIDLSGVDGVTPEEQARAENLIAITLARLPKFADPAVAESLGWHSIGDGITGYEHFVNTDLINDGRMLDPDFPESLVFRIQNGKKTLVSAMFMAPEGTTLDSVPNVGGTLTQWHIHNNLCFVADPTPRVVGLTNPDGTCSFGIKDPNPVPMIHVWIVPHPCGPFAALEGAGAGQIKPGETRWCDHAHGATA